MTGRTSVNASNPQQSGRNAQRLSQEERSGILVGFLCYLFWGLCPIYWKLLDAVSPFEVISHRIIWCFVFILIVCRVMRLDYVGLLRDRRALRYLVPAGLVITFNWSTYIYAIATDHLVDCALGYYINPLVSILFGLVVFKERLTVLQTVATVLAAAGVIYFTVDYGQLPAISLALALSFGLYSAIKKKGGYPAVTSIAVESTVALPIAVVTGIVTAAVTGSHAFLGDVTTAAGWGTTLLLIVAGPVTAVPLVLFARAANDIPLSLLGFIQYVSPTCSLLLGVFAYGEAFTGAHAVCFGLIWAGLVLVSIDAIMRSRKR